MNRRITYRRNGQTIIEFAAVLIVGLPLLLTLAYVGLSVCQYFAIKANLDTAARIAARTLAINYQNTFTKTDTYTGTLSIPPFIKPAANQFTVEWDTHTPPEYVRVTCKYPTKGNAGAGLPTLPNPDVLNVNRITNYNIVSTATMALF